MPDLKTLRLEAGLTQLQLATKCGVVRQTIAMIERGTNKPSVKLAKKLGEIFGVPWTLFFAD